MNTNKITDKNTIDSISMFLKMGADPTVTINSAIKNKKITEDFVNTFYNYITPEMFTRSYKLSAKMADKFPKLFLEELFLKYITGNDKEEDDGNQVNGGLQGLSSAGLISLVSGSMDTTHQLPIVHVSMVERYMSKLDSEMLETITLTTIRNAEESEFSELDSIHSLLGLSEESDKVLFMKIKDEETVNSFVLLKSMEEHGNPSFETFRHMSDEMRDSLLGENVEIEVLLKAFASTPSMEWKANKIKDIESGNIKVNPSSESFDSLVCSLSKAMPEDMLISFIKITHSNCKNLYNQKVITYILKEKNFSEDELIELIPVIKAAGMFIQMRNYAKKESLDRFLESLERSLHE